MSEVVSNESVEEVIPEAETEGQITEAIEEIESLSEREIELLPVDEHGDKYVSVKVDGKEVLVSLTEALSGYQRQADYTRKTQELSEQRRQVQFGGALQEALQKDPTATLELLKQHYGVAQSTSDEELYADPVEKQYRLLEQRVMAFEQDKAMDELQKTVEMLTKRYGADFDANEVVAKALALGSTDLESVYKQVAFDRVYEQSMGVRQLQAKAEDDRAKVVQTKRQASVVSGGGTAASADVSAKPITSLREAFEAAKRQHA